MVSPARRHTAGGDAAKHLSFVREDFGLAVISATKRLLRDLPDAEAGAVRAMTPGTARGWRWC